MNKTQPNTPKTRTAAIPPTTPATVAGVCDMVEDTICGEEFAVAVELTLDRTELKAVGVAIGRSVVVVVGEKVGPKFATKALQLEMKLEQLTLTFLGGCHR